MVQNSHPLVFVHGSGESSAIWRDVVAALAPRQVLAVDLPGHGARAAAQGPDRLSVVDYAEDVWQAIRHARLSYPVVAGHSLGGAIALQLGLDHGVDLAGLVLIGTGARLRVLPAFLEGAAADPERASQEMIRFGASPRTTPEQIERWVRDRAPVTGRVFHRDLAACNAFDVMAELEKIAVPALVICGEDDRLTPIKYAEYLATHLPRAELRCIPDAGHFVMLEQPDAFILVLRDWLDRLDAISW
jgi:pimeloyl-ACP methyl ester carboxylesterase